MCVEARRRPILRRPGAEPPSADEMRAFLEEYERSIEPAIEIQTERMAGRIEKDADVVLWLILGHGGAEFHRVGHGSRQIVHSDVDVHHHLLALIRRWPDWRHIVSRGLESQVGRGSRDGDGRPIVLLLGDRPPEQTGVEVGQGNSIGRLENYTPPIGPGSPAHARIMSPRRLATRSTVSPSALQDGPEVDSRRAG